MVVTDCKCCSRHRRPLVLRWRILSIPVPSPPTFRLEPSFLPLTNTNIDAAARRIQHSRKGVIDSLSRVSRGDRKSAVNPIAREGIWRCASSSLRVRKTILRRRPRSAFNQTSEEVAAREYSCVGCRPLRCPPPRRLRRYSPPSYILSSPTFPPPPAHLLSPGPLPPRRLPLLAIHRRQESLPPPSPLCHHYWPPS